MFQQGINVDFAAGQMLDGSRVSYITYFISYLLSEHLKFKGFHVTGNYGCGIGFEAMEQTL